MISYVIQITSNKAFILYYLDITLQIKAMKIKVLGGAIEKGNWGLYGNSLLAKGGLSNRQTLELKNNIKSLTILNQENIKSFAGSAGWGFVGTYIARCY